MDYALKISVSDKLVRSVDPHTCCINCNPKIKHNKAALLADLRVKVATLSGGVEPDSKELARYVQSLIIEIEEMSIVDSYHSIEMTVFHAITGQPQSMFDLVVSTGYNRVELKLALNLLSGYGWIEERTAEGKIDKARGPRRKFWHVTQKGKEEYHRLQYINSGLGDDYTGEAESLGEALSEGRRTVNMEGSYATTTATPVR